MNKRGLYTLVSICTVTILSIVLVVVDRPEISTVVSDDGIVIVEGEWRADQPVTITSLGDGRYELAPEVLTVSDPVRVTFAVDDTQQVYRWDADIEMWEESLSLFEDGRLGMFWISDPIDVDAPDFVTQQDQLLDMAPSDTVGYRIAVGIVTEAGDRIALPDKDVVGGCGGIFGRGNMIERSELEHNARVYINDVETLVHFLFVGRWTVDELGCGDHESLESVLY